MTSTEPEPLGVQPVDADALANLKKRATEPDQLRRALTSRLEVATDAPLTAIMNRLDQVLAERPHKPPEGTEYIDTATLADLRENAERGRTAHHRDLVSAAIRDGRIPPASRASWLTLLEVDANSEQTLRSLRRNTIPVAAVGNAGEPERGLYEELFRD